MYGNNLVHDSTEVTRSVVDVADRLTSRMNAEFVVRQIDYAVATLRLY